MKRHYNAKFDIEVEEEICRLYFEGVHNGSVVLAKKFNCNQTTIHNILKANGFTPRNNREAQTGLRVGENHPTWKGGNVSKDGYKRIYIGKDLVQEHRYIMEQYLGRKLLSTEIIHHINHNKLDNRIENLEILDRSTHARLHDSERQRTYEGQFV